MTGTRHWIRVIEEIEECKKCSCSLVSSKLCLCRDIKLENLLLTRDLQVKLCDLGSASSRRHFPDPSWSMEQRRLLEEDLAQHTTPSYRAPEMVDTWANQPITQVSCGVLVTEVS